MKGSVVVFLHGFMGGARQFGYLLPLVRESGWAIRTVVLPGHNAGLREFARAGRKMWQEDVNRLLDDLREKYDEIVLVGHSMGGLLAIRAAAENPEKIGTILAIALPLRLRASIGGIKTRLLSLLPAKEGEDVRVSAARRMCGVHGVTVANSIRLLPNALGLLRVMKEARTVLGSLSVPLTVVNSYEDEVVAPRSTLFVKSSLPLAEIVQLTESSHFWYSDKEQALIAGILRRTIQRLP